MIMNFARFRQELLLARQVSSPHVVRIHHLVQHGETWMISMDFIAGRSLEARIDEGTPVPLDEALRVARQLALGLAAAHARGVVHRDLKTANVLLDDEGNAYISDFGVARAAGATRMTGTGMVVGTPDYLSPEQALAEPLDGRSDQYALGLILREMLTGRLPFAGGTAAEMMTQRVVNEAPSLQAERPDLPPWVIALTDRLLRRLAAQRFDDTGEIAQVIAQARLIPTISDHAPRRVRIGAAIDPEQREVIRVGLEQRELHYLLDDEDRAPDDRAGMALLAEAIWLAVQYEGFRTFDRERNRTNAESKVAA